MVLTAEDLSSSDDERSQELATLASIFPDELTIHTSFSATITLPITPLAPLQIQFTPSNHVESFAHLPPLTATFNLPATYPATTPPHLELSATPPWIPPTKLAELTASLATLYAEYNDQILYLFLDALQQAAEQTFSLPHPLLLPDDFRDPLRTYQTAQKQLLFSQGTYTCEMCLEPKKGASCHQIRSCHHVFCRKCLVEYYETQITEGEIAAVRCVNQECVKGAAKPPKEEPKTKREKLAASIPPTLPPEELREVGVTEELVERYVGMKRKKALDKDPDTIYCTRQWCQGPVRSCLEELEAAMEGAGGGFWLRDKDAPVVIPAAVREATEEGKEKTELDEDEQLAANRSRLQVCSKCSFAFCRVCRASWHGEYLICRAPDSALTEDELANEQYIKDNTTPCPTCRSPVIKSHGCNHMTCSCGTHFCFLCSAYLPIGNPYTHFNTEFSECYNMLWEEVEGDQENVARIQAEGEAPEAQAPPAALPLPQGGPPRPDPPQQPAGNLENELAAFIEAMDFDDLLDLLGDGAEQEREVGEVRVDRGAGERQFELAIEEGRGRGHGRGRGRGRARGRGRGRGGAVARV